MKTLRYIPELNKATGSINATLLLLQLEYWFTKTKGKSFFKFLEPCTHEAYRPTDSWVEELGFSKAEFRHAFSQIGKVYKSRTAYQNSTDPFEGKLYLSYFDRMRKITYYIRNTNEVTKLLASYTITTNISRDLDCEDGLSLDNNIILPSINDTDNISPIDSSSASTPYLKIINHFHTTCPHLKAVSGLSTKHQKLMDTLWHYTNYNLESIFNVFNAVAQNDFLSGRLPENSWKASFDWIITTSSFDKITNGYYTPYTTPATIPTPHSILHSSPKKSRFHNICTHNWDFDLLEKLEDEYITQKLAASTIAC
ncbi:MAG: hypothetical protein AB9856_20125 [Cellulosilyticaceae bacterium]